MSLKEAWVATCSICNTTQVVCGVNTPGGAVMEAEFHHWHFNKDNNKWYCPVCRYE